MSSWPGSQQSRSLLCVQKYFVSPIIALFAIDVPEFVAFGMQIKSISLDIAHIYLQPDIAIYRAGMSAILDIITAPYMTMGFECCEKILENIVSQPLSSEITVLFGRHQTRDGELWPEERAPY